MFGRNMCHYKEYYLAAVTALSHQKDNLFINDDIWQ